MLGGKGLIHLLLWKPLERFTKSTEKQIKCNFSLAQHPSYRHDNWIVLSLSFFFLKKSCNDFEIIPNKEKSGGRGGARKRLPLSGRCWFPWASLTDSCHCGEGERAGRKTPADTPETLDGATPPWVANGTKHVSTLEGNWETAPPRRTPPSTRKSSRGSVAG